MFLFLQNLLKSQKEGNNNGITSLSLKHKQNINLWSNYVLGVALFVFIINNIFKANWNGSLVKSIVAFVTLWGIMKLMIKKVNAEVGKMLLLIVAYSFIFFLELTLGSNVGILFFYFAIIISIISLFKWETEKFDTVLFVMVLPAVLMLVVNKVRSYFLIDFNFNNTNDELLYKINCCIAFIVITIKAISMIAVNSKLEDKNLEIEMNLNTLLDNTSANIRTINTNYEVSAYNNGFKNMVKKHYKVDVKKGFNVKYDLFGNANFPTVLKESYVKALCGERVNVEYISNNEYFELMAAPLETEGEIKGAILYDRDITEKKKKEFELNQFILDLKTLIDNTQGAIWSINNKYEVITANESFINTAKKIFNVNIYVGYCMLELYSILNFPEEFKMHNINVMSGNILNTQYEHLGQYFEINGRPLKNEQGEIVGATFHHINITERKVNEKRVEQLSLNLQSLIDNTNNSIWSIDSNYKLITANSVYIQNFKKYFGIDVIIGFNLKNVFKHQAFPETWKSYYEEVLKGNNITVTYDYDEKIFELSAKPIIKNDIIIGAAFFATDVTESYTNTAKIKQSEINLQTIINNNTGNVWGIDKSYRILACNESFKTEMYNQCKIDVVPGYNMNEVFVCSNYPSNLIEIHKKVLEGEKIVTVYDSENKYFELTGVPINVDNEIVGAAFFSEDITMKMQHEKELINAKVKAEEASKAKARFLSNMSHELRTPLNGVIGITNILIDEEKLESQQKHLDILKYSSDHMYSLINDILDFSKIDEGKIVLENTPFNLQSTIDKTMVMFTAEAKNKGLEFIVNANGIQDLSIIGDVTRLRQVLNNLITNAIKFTEKGKVELSVRKMDTLSNKKATVEFTISDTGIGICQDKLETIFDSFTQADVDTTRKYGGTGLGLTISRRLVEIMGGNLTVKSTLHQGTIFKFEITFENVETNSTNKNIEEIRNLGNIKILLAEDNKINMLVARKQLEKWGVEVDEAENGEVAYKKFLQKEYDVILMDMEMPVLDGLAATELIRKVNTTIPVLALTAASFENMNDFLMEKGLNGFVRKPFAPLELNKKIYEALLISQQRVLQSIKIINQAS